jgi:hypothetical protein
MLQGFAVLMFSTSAITVPRGIGVSSIRAWRPPGRPSSWRAWLIAQFRGLLRVLRHCSVLGSCVHIVSLLSFRDLLVPRVIAQFRGLARASCHCSVSWTCASTVCNRSVMAKGVAWKVAHARKQMCRCSMSCVIAQIRGLILALRTIDQLWQRVVCGRWYVREGACVNSCLASLLSFVDLR